jgi:hypothetical protein
VHGAGAAAVGVFQRPLVRNATAADGEQRQHGQSRKPSPLRDNFFTHSCVVTSETKATVSEMQKTIPFPAPHRHKAVTTHYLAQREGIPYEMQRVLCSECRRVLEERRLRRAAA